MPDATQNANSDVIMLRKGDQTSRIDETNVAGLMTQDSHLARVGSERFSILQGLHPARAGHQLINHCFRFCCDSVNDVIDTDCLADMVIKKSNKPTQTRASTMAPRTVATGAKG